MPRIKSDPRKRKLDSDSLADNFSSVSGVGDVFSATSKKAAMKREPHCNFVEKPFDIRSVKSVSTKKLSSHHSCYEDAKHLSLFDSYIHIHHSIKAKFHIGHIVVDINEDLSLGMENTIYGLYIGDDTTCLLCLVEDVSEDELQEKYFISSTCVPPDILRCCATKYFIVRYAARQGPRNLLLEILLSPSSFMEVHSGNEYPKGGKQLDIRNVVEFFCGTEETKKQIMDVHSPGFLSHLFDNMLHDKPYDIDVQHPDLIPQLRPYQKEAVQWMLSREKKQGFPVPKNSGIHPLFKEFQTIDGVKLHYNKVAGFFSLEPQYAPEPCKGGILADEMGLGKTVEVLACILNNPKCDTNVDLTSQRKARQKSVSQEVKSTDFSLEGIFSCCCGKSSCEESELHIVTCHRCGIAQHAECFNYFPVNSSEDYCCPHCWIRNTAEVNASGATLIVSPHRICYQWQEEIKKHVKGKSLQMFYYQGLAHHGFIQPQVLAGYDIVLTTYEVLKKELNYMDLPYSSRSRSLRRPQKFYCAPSPLSAVLWWRVCLDEAQMAEHATSKMAKMALELNSVHRWCVTGTPVQKNVDDLYGLFLFLGCDPYCNRMWWREALFQPFCKGNPDPLIEAFKPLLWRTVKRNVLNQINIPPQDMVMEWVKFSPVEEYFYNERSLNCVSNLGNRLSSVDLNLELKSLDKNFLREVWTPIRELRQACCHPQVVKGHFAPVQKSFLSMSEVLGALIKKAQAKAGESHRLFICFLNGLAGVHIIMKNIMEAIICYKKVLSSAHKYRNTFQTDKCQLYHALYNLSEILSDEVVDVPPVLENENEGDSEESEHTEEETEEYPLIKGPLSKTALSSEAESIRTSYLERASTAVNSAMQKFSILSKEVDHYSAVISSNQPWWILVCDYSVKIQKDEELLTKLTNDLLSIRILGKPTLANKFSDISGLCFNVYSLLTALHSSHDALRKAVVSLYEPSEDDVAFAASCHLRRDCRCRRRRSWCKYCEADQQFRVVEQLLFQCAGKTTEQMDENPRPSTSADIPGPSNLTQYSAAGTQGIWADSELERVFKTVFSFAKSNHVKADILRNGRICLMWISTLKKEFKALRNIWLKISDYVAAVDEMNMASQRLRLRHPDEELPHPHIAYILDQNHVAACKASMLADEPRFNGELRDALQKLSYLQNLKQRESEATCDNSKICPVCHQGLRSMWTILPCGHSLCSECVHHLMREYHIPNDPTLFRCPVCREETLNKDVFFVGNKTESPLDKEFPVEGDFSSKVTAIVQCLMKLSKEDPSAKSIIFSEWLELLNIIASALEKNQIKFVSLHCKKTFQKDLQKFKTDSTINTALLPIFSCSSGLNIIEATHVLLVAPHLHTTWEMQAIGRVHRIGQTKKTVIHRFIVKDSIEERVYNLLPGGFQSEDELKQRESSLTLKDLQELF